MLPEQNHIHVVLIHLVVDLEPVLHQAGINPGYDGRWLTHPDPHSHLHILYPVHIEYIVALNMDSNWSSGL